MRRRGGRGRRGGYTEELLLLPLSMRRGGRLRCNMPVVLLLNCVQGVSDNRGWVVEVNQVGAVGRGRKGSGSRGRGRAMVAVMLMIPGGSPDEGTASLLLRPMDA